MGVVFLLRLGAAQAEVRRRDSKLSSVQRQQATTRRNPMAKTKTSETKKPATRSGKHRSPAAMTASNSRRHRAGHGRHSSDRPTAVSTSGIAYTANDKGDDTAGTKHGLAKERGRQRKGDQQRATREFAFGQCMGGSSGGGGEHPQASDLNRHINVPPAGMPYFVSSKGTGAGQHATAA